MFKFFLILKKLTFLNYIFLRFIVKTLDLIKIKIYLFKE